jgi:hypothetical protein
MIGFQAMGGAESARSPNRNLNLVRLRVGRCLQISRLPGGMAIVPAGAVQQSINGHPVPELPRRSLKLLPALPDQRLLPREGEYLLHSGRLAAPRIPLRQRGVR